jgi:3-methyladenine DNA glycosylase/8-oxoguanine DNA glycosylase
MPSGRVTVREAVAAVSAADPVMAALAVEHGRPMLGARRTGLTRFEQLAEAICYQQLAGKAAEAIWSRTRAIVDGPFTPEAVLDAGYDALRTAGSSGSKALSTIDLAEKVASGEVRLDRIGRLTDEQVVAELVQVKGIGPWTAEMFLIFTLRRLDVWPVGDYGVRVGYGRAYGLAEPPSSKDLLPLGDRFRPYRTIAAWYCWRVAGTKPPD